jgi:membrane protease YdiL (CAAX protease family)
MAGQYFEADKWIDKVLFIKRNNFTANFYKIRIAVMLNQYQKAIELINLYKSVNFSSQVNELLTLWGNFCISKLNFHDEGISKSNLNIKTDSMLEFYQHHRVIKLRDLLLSLSFIIFIMLFRSAVCVFIIKIKMAFELSADLTMVLFTLFLVYFYNTKTALKSDNCTLFLYCIKKVRLLIHSTHFKSVCGMLLLVAAMQKQTSSYYPLALIFVYPIGEELFFRGLLYNYLKKFGQGISWTVVTAVFFMLHLGMGNYFHILLSLCCLLVYDEEKTILAPILVHILYNTIAII